MNLITAIDVNASGLTAQRKRVELSSSNLANSQTTRTLEGGAYRRKDLVFQTASFQDSLGAAIDKGVQGVEVSDIVDDPRPFDRRYEPGHPDVEKGSQGELQKFLSNESDLHSVMIALEKADLSFQVMMQVRNKIVQAYQELMKSQV